ncbi:MAG: XTP/dITP diphosphatase [Spirochaetes bacterium]|nr:XTP/dITP diphosphatase [Spirochaetota bacterium]
MKLVIATNNKNKLNEIREKFTAISGLEILSLADFNNAPETIEDGITFEENAVKKAREVSAFTGLTALADDSGLVVEALDGRPGVLSARYGGRDTTDLQKNILILKEMKAITDGRRNARFVCVIAIALPDGREYSVRGECEGVIARELKGGHGFGYDPIFYLPGSGKTMAELPLTEKNKISHRAVALERALEVLKKISGS